MSLLANGSPEGSTTIFTTLCGQFPEIEDDDTQKIKTQEFLDAASGVVMLIEKFGKVFAPVIHDMNGNIRKITDIYEEDKNSNQYLEEMILSHKDAGEMIVVDALQWLRRGIHFIGRFLQLVIEDSDSNNNAHDLSPLVKSAYKETLERYHGWLGSQLFNILSRFVPNRQQLFYQLALENHNREQQVLHDMRVYVQKLLKCVQKLIEFYQEYDLETNDRV